MGLAPPFTRTRSRTWSTATLALAGLTASLAVGCADSSKSPPTAPTAAPKYLSGPSAALGANASEALDQVARALALALGDPAVRTLVKDELRASPYVAHKVVLQDFVRTVGGGRVLAAAAQRAGVTATALAASVASLPAVDLVVPRREDRLTWDGTGPVTVLATLDRRPQQAHAYTPDGGVVTYAARDTVKGATLLMLRPAKSNGRRMDPQPAGPGRTIQDANDGEVSVTYVVSRRGGDSTVTGFASLRELRTFNAARGAAAATPRAGSGFSAVRSSAGSALPGDGGATPNMIPCGEEGADPSCDYQPPPPPSGGTFLRALQTYDACYDTSFGFCDSQEFEFKAHATQVPCVFDEYKIRLEGIGTSIHRDMDIFFFPQNPHSGCAMYLWVVETDTGSDTELGHFTLDASDTPASGRTDYFSVGVDRCGVVAGCGYPRPQWKEVNVQFEIRP